MKIRFLLLALSLGAPLVFADSKTSLITSVHSKTFHGYQRAKTKDGKFKPEYYALSIGGALPGTLQDTSIEKVPVPQLAGVLGQFLWQQNYHLARDSKSAELLLLVNWGRTTPGMNGQSSAMSDVAAALGDAMREQGAVDAAAALAGVAPVGVLPSDELQNALAQNAMLNGWRDDANEANASLLGYAEAINRVIDRVPGAGSDSSHELIGDIEDPRYYLIISAFDFREMVEKKNQKLLWATRVSIRAPGNSFDKDFAAMLAKAAEHLGQDSGGLLRRYDPKGRVDIGEMEVLGMSPAAIPEKSK